MRRQAAKSIAPDGEWLSVESLDLEGQGIAHRADGKVVFIEGALPGEQVQVQVHRRKKQWEQAEMISMRAESSQRVAPRCRYFGVCGGCKMQHLQAGSQLIAKQRALEDALWHLGKVRPLQVLRPIDGPAWGYRYRARLSVRYVEKKSKVLVGFHERQSSYVADMGSCEVLPPRVSALLVPLAHLVEGMDQRSRLPQIEVAVGDSLVALVLRHLEPLTPGDRLRLAEFAAAHGVQWWLQPEGPITVHRLDDACDALTYQMPEFGITITFKPTDFTQVNHAINRVLVGQAVQLLNLQPNERAIDWFCGLGNFSLPMATRAREVLGIEGSDALVARSAENARHNALAHKVSFAARNLFELVAADLPAFGSAQKWLIDPPREGAFALAKALCDAVASNAEAISGWVAPSRIVYVSCNPATLARDAGLLVHQAGYALSAAGVVNMFPHTAHVESIAVFDRMPT
jgi:23S rRNA (uracil1939-C5)-methyltransferase